MEIGISIFIGAWFVVSGLAAILFLFKDFKDNDKKEESDQ